MAFFFQAEDGIRDLTVTGVQTCALPISRPSIAAEPLHPVEYHRHEAKLHRHDGEAEDGNEAAWTRQPADGDAAADEHNGRQPEPEAHRRRGRVCFAEFVEVEEPMPRSARLEFPRILSD